MLKKQEIKKWILENCVDEEGDVNLAGLDFSDFEGSVCLSDMNVGGDLFQERQIVKGSLMQDSHNVEGDLYQGDHRVGEHLFQDTQSVKGNLHQDYCNVEGDLHQDYQKVKGDLFQDSEKDKTAKEELKPYLYEEKSREELVQLIEDKNLIISSLCETIRKIKNDIK